MTVPEFYNAKNNWPHRFTRDGKEIKVGEDGGVPLFKVPMICIDCHIKYMTRMENKPVGACPARNDRKEYKRLGVDNPNDSIII